MKWPVQPIGEVFAVARGGSPRPIQNFLTDAEDGINWIMISDATEGSKYITKTKRRIKPTGLKKSRMVYEGDFLLTNSMSFGHPYILKTSGCIHDGWLVLSPREKNISRDFFYYLLGSDALYSEFSKRAAGAVVKNLNIEIVKSVQIPLPPVAEQKRIAAILDAADALRAKRREALAQLDALLQSSFLTLFGDPVSNPMGWKNDSLGNHGSFKNGLNYGNSEKGFDVRCLGVGDFKAHSKIENVDALPLLKLDSRPSEGYFLKDADLVFVRSNGNKALVGRCLSIFPGKTPTTFSGFCIRYRIESGDLNPAYLTHLFRSKSFRVKLLQSGQGANIQNINQQILCALPIPLPPLPLQQKFAAIVEYIERQKAAQRAHLAELDALFAALQHRAFRGEL